MIRGVQIYTGEDYFGSPRSSASVAVGMPPTQPRIQRGVSSVEWRNIRSTYEEGYWHGYDPHVFGGPFDRGSGEAVAYQAGKTMSFGGTVLGLVVSIAEIPAAIVTRMLWDSNRVYSTMDQDRNPEKYRTTTTISSHGGRPKGA